MQSLDWTPTTYLKGKIPFKLTLKQNAGTGEVRTYNMDIHPAYVLC